MSKPVISVEALKEVVASLDRALQDHTTWLMGWHRAIICEMTTEVSDQYLHEDAHHRCRFGSWYYNNTQAYIGSFPTFFRVEDTHKALHDRGRKLLYTAMQGEKISSTEYDAFLELREEFRSLLRILDTELHATLLETDPLTLLANRQNIIPLLNEKKRRLEESHEETVVCMVDIDHFKNVNDTYGHLVGDQVLKAVARFLSDHVRHNDKIFRFGGEEFLIAFSGTVLSSAKMVADKLRHLLSEQTIAVADNIPLHITASFGLASLQARVDVNEIIKCADKALYTAKHAGRNQVCYATYADTECTIRNILAA